MDEQKLSWAQDFGATDTVNAKEFDVVEAIQDLTDGNGADVVIDAVGDPRPGNRPFTHAISQAPSSWSGCPHRT